MLDSTTRSFDLFPHLLLMGGNWVEIVSGEFEDGSSGGLDSGAPEMGRLVWGWNDFVIGCSFSNPANGNLLGNAMMNGNAYNYMGPVDLRTADTSTKTSLFGINPFQGGEFLTAVFAAPSGEGGFAVNLGVYLDKNNTTFANDGGETNIKGTGYAIGASFGNGDNLDVAAQISLLSAENENSTVDPTVLNETSVMNFAGYGEFHLDDVNRIQAGIMFGSASSTDSDGEGDDDDQSDLGVLLGLGRTLSESDDQIITAEFFLQFVTTTTTGTAGADVDDVPEDKTSTIVLPGTRVAARHQLTDRFSLNAGAVATYSTRGTEDTTGDATGETSNAFASFGWDAGLTAVFGPLTIDTFLFTSNLGKMLSLGNEEAMVGGVSATATF